ncbi:putative integral membrane protein [Erysiphe necator]|uniref:Putative integral membrane protein n=1 Tax=Uncinula necator TaxID=52586 RepID=A0A0B1NVQ9_UNCNE|nr:putative integral membrane protein [Erysiphe necator]
MMSFQNEPLTPEIPIFRYTIGFILIGLAWGFTTPFIRRATRTHQPVQHPLLDSLVVKNSWVRRHLCGLFFDIVDVIKNPRYAIPLAINLTGSIWFFLLIGKTDMSLTVPITNSFSFLFTVAGDWYLDRKIISRDTWIGMSLTLGGIILCVHSKDIGQLVD